MCPRIPSPRRRAWLRRELRPPEKFEVGPSSPGWLYLISYLHLMHFYTIQSKKGESPLSRHTSEPYGSKVTETEELWQASWRARSHSLRAAAVESDLPRHRTSSRKALSFTLPAGGRRNWTRL